MIQVLFVCMGNICRSPTVEGIFRKLVAEAGLAEQIQCDSAGTHSYHLGAAPDARALEAARGHGIDLSQLRARQVQLSDFQVFDYILAMDKQNLRSLQSQCPQTYQHKLHLLLDFAPELGTRKVPDPYNGGPGDFEHVFDLGLIATQRLLAHLRQEHQL